MGDVYSSCSAPAAQVAKLLLWSQAEKTDNVSALVSKQNVNVNQQLRHIGSDRMGENESFSMSSHGVVEEESTEEIFSNATTGRPSQPGLGQLFTSGTSWSFGGFGFWLLIMFGPLTVCFVISYVVHLVHSQREPERARKRQSEPERAGKRAREGLGKLSNRWWSWCDCGSKGSTTILRGKPTGPPGQARCWAWGGSNGRTPPFSMWGRKMSLRITNIRGTTISLWEVFCLKLTRSIGRQRKRFISESNQCEKTTFLHESHASISVR